MDSFLRTYLIGWAAACVLACALFAIGPKRYSISRVDYWRFLFTPWKLLTFVPAAVGIAVVAPYTGDPTWDYYDATFMSVLAFTTAPWATGTLAIAPRGRSSWRDVYLAACVWMFSASWSYDLYLLLRDGTYPVTWSANLAASSVLYLCAGLMWNLEWAGERGVIFAFMREGWPSPASTPQFRRVFWTALPIMLIVGISILYFLM